MDGGGAGHENAETRVEERTMSEQEIKLTWRNHRSAGCRVAFWCRDGSPMTQRCVCCDKPLSPVACFDGWCATCAGTALNAILSLRDGSWETVGARVSILRDWGADALARAVVGAIPFEREA